MAHRTQLYLDDSEYDFLKNLAKSKGKSIAQIVREWIAEKKAKRNIKSFDKDPIFKIRGLFSSGAPDMAKNFDDYLYGGKE